MKEYCFPAACAPEELKERMAERVRKERTRELVRKVNKEPWADLKLTWREELEFDFRFKKVVPFGGKGVNVDAGPGRLSLQAGIWEGASASFSETFRGRLEPDGQDGSVLRGHFTAWGWSSGFFALFGLLSAVVALTLDPLGWLGAAIVAVQWGRHLTRLDKYPASQTILAFFEDVTAGTEADEEEGTV